MAAFTKKTAQGATSGGEKHFVDRHRAGLIQRVGLVAPILDDLYQEELLTQEQYDTVRSMRTAQEQMRELYRYAESWGNKGKDKFLAFLGKHNSQLVEDLEKNQSQMETKMEMDDW